MVSGLRILYLVLAIVFGLGLAIAGVLGLFDLLQGQSTNGSNGPPPFSLSSYAYTPVIAAIVLLSGYAAFKHRWEALALACWFLLGGAVLEASYVIWLLVRYGTIPESVDDAFAVVWALFSVPGLLLTVRAGSQPEPRSRTGTPASTQERIRLRNTLIGMVAISYFWRAIVVATNPGLTFAIAFLRGLTDPYGSEQVVLSGVIGLGVAIVLLVCVVVSSKPGEKIVLGALAFTAGFAFEGFLDTLDYAFWLGSPREFTSSLQDAVAFVACCAALALSMHGERMSSRLTPA
jgi:hypothetical protein